ncbi:MAG: hypothetical protein QME07_06830 [bacterium]|nr:hypothetical protein [bacterium]
MERRMKKIESDIEELKKQMKELDRYVDVLREYARQEPRLAAIMKAKGLL